MRNWLKNYHIFRKTGWKFQADCKKSEQNNGSEQNKQPNIPNITVYIFTPT